MLRQVSNIPRPLIFSRGNSRRKSKDKSPPVNDASPAPATSSNASNNNDGSSSVVVESVCSPSLSVAGTTTITSRESGQSTQSPPSRDNQVTNAGSPRHTSSPSSKISRIRVTNRDNSSGQSVNQVTILVKPKTVPDKNRSSEVSPVKKNKNSIPIPRVKTRSRDREDVRLHGGAGGTCSRNNSTPKDTRDPSVLSSPPSDDDDLPLKMESDIFHEEMTWNEHKTEDSKKDLSDKEVTTLLSKESSWSSDDNTVVSKDISEHADREERRDLILIRDQDVDKVLEELGDGPEMMMTSGQVQTEDDDEKSDPVKEHLELQVEELRAQLELQSALLRREQEQLSQMYLESQTREGLRQELEQEKMMRAEAEVRLREVRLENECCKARLATLQEDFRKMEEMVREMIQFKTRIDQLKHEKSSLAITYESKMRKYQTYIASLEKENFMLLNELKSVEISKSERQEEQDRSLSRVLLERVRLLEQENATLSLENEQQRLQYEHCLDDVANQVVQALLAQKNLREECGKLQLRVQELEQQNRSLSHVFKTHFIRPIAAGTVAQVDLWPSRLRADSSEIVLPFNSSQQELRLETRTEPRDSPNTSQSEDSTESLASLCSDYSLHSSGSGVYHNSQDHQKMSSPPKWLIDQSSTSRPTAAVAVLAASSSLGVSDQSQKCTIWAELLRKAEMNCLSQSNQVQKLSSEASCQRDADEATKEDWKQAFLRERGNSRRRWSVLRASSEIGDLDSMDTPSDETAPFDGFSLATSRFRLSFPALVSTNHHSTEFIDNNRASIIFPPPPAAPSFGVYENSDLSTALSSAIAISPPTRPTTLNIVPHIMGDPSSNFANYQSLERKSHVVNKSGNMYEELDLPAFPQARDRSSNPSCSNESPENRLRDNSREFHFIRSDREPNTVVRKTSSLNQMTTAGDTVIRNGSFALKNPSNISSPTLPPPCVLDDPILNSKRVSDSPLSAGVSEHGKDEGYSTMSSDVQCETNEPPTIVPPRLNAALPRSSSPVAKIITLPRESVVVNQPVNDYLMASSSDSGLNSTLTRDIVEEENSGFERELDSSLIRRCDSKAEERETRNKPGEDDSSAPEENLGQLDSGLGDSPQNHRVSSFSEPPDFGLPRDEEDNEKNNEKSLHRSSLDPSYDKILTLLTPRGFRPPCSASPRLSNNDCKIETAEKATYTEPEAYFQTEFASEGSLYSVECGNTGKSCPDNNSCDGDCESSSSFIRFDQNPLPTASLIPKSKTFPWYDASDIYAVACRYCRSRGTKHGLEFATRVEALGTLLRAFSDSHLVIKKTFDEPLAMRSDSLGTRCPPLRLNLLPLERHSSAVDLSPVSEPITIRKNDRGGKMSVETKNSKSTHWACLPSEHRPSPSLSLSTVHSSSSGEVASVEDDEELGATSLKCSRERDISSESDNDLSEHNHLVEQWLQKGSAEISQKLGFTYDEEEIGNWSFQLSAEDLSQGQVSQWERDRWTRSNYDNPSSSERSSTQKLEKIRENAEYDDFWNAPPFWQKNSKETASISENPKSLVPISRPEPGSSNGTFIRAPKVSPIEEKSESVVPSSEDALNSVNVEIVPPEVTEISTELDKDRMGKNQSTLESACRCGEDGHNLCGPCEEGLQAEVCEFNRDFYRLCSTDSTRSLAASSKSLSECGCLEHAHLKRRLLLNESAIVKIEENSSPVETKRKPISSATFRKKRTSESLPKVDLPVVGDEEAMERTKDSSGIEEERKSSVESSRTSGIPIINKLPAEKRKTDKTRIPVSTKMATKIPKQNEVSTTSISSSKHSRHHRSSSANNEERSKRHAERNRLQRSYSEENRGADKISSQSSPKHFTAKESSRCNSSKTTPQSSRPGSSVQKKSPSRKSSGEKKIPKAIARKTVIEGEKKNEETIVTKKEIPKRSTSRSQSLESKQSSVKEKDESNVRESSIEKNNEVKKREKNSSKKRRSKEGCGTSWVHFETDVDLSDPKARANLLDSMMASSSSSGGTDTDEEVPSIAPSSTVEKIEEEREEEEIVEPVKEKEKVIQHTKHEKLHALHKFRRQKKKVSDPDAVISIFPRLRASIIDRHDFYYRFGEKEQEAVACFDFLDELSTSPSDVDTCDLESSQKGACASGICERIRQESYRAMEGRDNYLEALDLGGNTLNSSDKYSNRLSLDEAKLFSRRSSPHDSFSSTTLNSQDFGDHISLSDSCAESYNSSTNSLNRIM